MALADSPDSYAIPSNPNSNPRPRIKITAVVCVLDRISEITGECKKNDMISKNLH